MSASDRRADLPMRILLLHNYYRSATPGGEDLVFEQERSLLSAAGHQVASYTRSNDEMSEISPIDIVRVISGMHRSRRTERELSDIIERFQPEVAHVHNTFPLISSSAHEICRAKGIPVVQTVHNYRLTCVAATHFRDGRVCESCSPMNVVSAITHRCYRGSALGSLAVASMVRHQWRSGVWTHCVDRFIALTQFTAKRLVDLGIPADRITVKPNFVQTPASGTVKKSDYVVFVGRVSEEKGIHTLLKTWRNTDLPLLRIIGDGPLRPLVESQVRDLDLNVRVEGARPRSEVSEIVAGALAQIVPSQWFEGMPMVILEAWALGTPVIATRIGSLEEMLDSDRFGLSIRAGDSEDLLEKVKALATSPGLQTKLANAGRDRVRSEFSPESTLKSLESIYGGLVKNRVTA